MMEKPMELLARFVPGSSAPGWVLDLIHARDAEWQARVDRLEELAEDVRQWSEAYPTKIFHEPTPEEVRKVCDAVGVPLDCIAAMVLREFTKPWGDRARAALEGGQG